jgi:hypothetical protein
MVPSTPEYEKGAERAMGIEKMLRTVTKRAAISLAFCALLLLLRLCVACLLGICHYPAEGEANVFQGAFIIVDSIFSLLSMVPWGLISPSHRVNALLWQWFLALDFLIIGVVWGLAEALWKRHR